MGRAIGHKVTLEFDPSVRRQFGDRGVFVLWRDGPVRRQGVVCAISTCTESDCTCTEVQISASEIDGLAQRASVTERAVSVKSLAAPEGQSRKVSIAGWCDLETRTWKPVARTDPIGFAAWFLSELDDHLRLHIQEERDRLIALRRAVAPKPAPTAAKIAPPAPPRPEPQPARASSAITLPTGLIPLLSLRQPEPARPAAAPAMTAGRNDLCPCGSGRKFKKCCLGRGTAGLQASS